MHAYMRVSVWILNQRRKEKAVKNTVKSMSKHQHHTGYHLFQKEQKNDPGECWFILLWCSVLTKEKM